MHLGMYYVLNINLDKNSVVQTRTYSESMVKIGSK